MRSYDAHKSTSEVRQGSDRRMNFRVLLWSLLGIVVAFGIIYAISTSIQPGGSGSITQPGPQPTQPEVPAADPTTTPMPAA